MAASGCSKLKSGFIFTRKFLHQRGDFPTLVVFEIFLRKFRENVQKQPPEIFCKKGVLKNFAKFTGNYFLIKLQLY